MQVGVTGSVLVDLDDCGWWSFSGGSGCSSGTCGRGGSHINYDIYILTLQNGKMPKQCFLGVNCAASTSFKWW